jgi:hypothetical protein
VEPGGHATDLRRQVRQALLSGFQAVCDTASDPPKRPLPPPRRLHALSAGIICLRAFADSLGRQLLAAQSRAGVTAIFKLDERLHPSR